jgi:hypothetical protein
MLLQQRHVFAVTMLLLTISKLIRVDKDAPCCTSGSVLLTMPDAGGSVHAADTPEAAAAAAAAAAATTQPLHGVPYFLRQCNDHRSTVALQCNIKSACYCCYITLPFRACPIILLTPPCDFVTAAVFG